MNMKIDPLTGGGYDKEKEMYTNYFYLTEEQAILIMSKLTYKERDAAFLKIIRERKRYFNS